MENYSQICGQSTTTTNFSEAEKLAFDRAAQALSAMPFASLPDLEQAGCSYYAEGFRLEGVSVSGEYIQRKGQSWPPGGTPSIRLQGKCGRTPSTRQRKLYEGGKWPLCERQTGMTGRPCKSS